ncbi:MAG: RNA-guided endonuclease InsQ/TnpB family protein, partial [Halobacteriales archaeon]
QKTGDWTVSIVVEYDAEYPDKPVVEDIAVKDTVGIDLGITKLVHDSENRTFARLDEEDDRKRIERRHRLLSRKQHGSANWDKARQLLAKAYERLKTRRKDYREKLANWYTREYNAVFLEDLDVASMMQQDRSSRNIAAMSWYQTIQAFKRHGEKNGCHVVVVDPDGTTKQCADCGDETAKPLWVREHSCPSCGFTTNRDHNASLETHQRGLEKLGVEFEQSEVGLGQSEQMSVETGVTAGRRHRDVLLANTVAEAESPNLANTVAEAWGSSLAQLQGEIDRFNL